MKILSISLVFLMAVLLPLVHAVAVPEATTLMVTDSVNLGAIRGVGDQVWISATYSGVTSGPLTDSVANCSYTMSDVGTGGDYGSGELTYSSFTGTFSTMFTPPVYLGQYFDGVSWVENRYVVNIQCDGGVDFDSAYAQNSFEIVSDSCNNVNPSASVTTLIEDMMCGEPSNAQFLFSSSHSGQVLDCGGHTITNTVTSSDRYGVLIRGSDNVTIQNCIFSGFGVAIHAVNGSTYSVVNVTIENSQVGIAAYDADSSVINNVTITGTTTGILITNATGNSVSDITMDNVETGIAIHGNDNSEFNNVNINAATYGIISDGESNSFDSISINNSNVSLRITQSGSVFTNLNIVNSSGVITSESPVAKYAAIDVAAPYNNFDNLFVDGSGTEGVFVNTSNTSLSNLNISGTVGSGIVLGSNALTGVSITNSSGASLESNSNAVYYLVFPQSLFINASGIILNFTDIDTGALPFNLYDLVHYVTITPSFVYVNSTAMPSLSRPAEITLAGTSYANVDSFNVLRDGGVCSAPQCVKVSNNPVTFRVTGFSNYTTQVVAPTTPAPASPGASGSGASGSGNAGLGAGGSSAPKTNSTTSTANTTNSTNTSGNVTGTSGQAGSQSSTGSAKSSDVAPASTATGLFTLDQLKGTTGAYVGVGVVLVLLGIGYVVFVRK